MRICHLREKEVIDVCTCKCIGFVIDVEFDECSGKICALVIPGPAKVWGMFGREGECVIPWCDIVKIGPDIILVEIRKEEEK